MTNRYTIRQRPGAMTIVLVLAITGIVLTALLSISVIATNQIGQVRDLTESDQTFFAAESGLNKAIYMLRTDSVPTIPAEIINGATVTVTVTIQPGNPYGRIVTATALHPNGQRRSVRVTATTSTFALGNNYAVQAGSGGIIVRNGSRILGDVFSNGSILPDSGQSGQVLPDDTGTFPGNATVADVGNRIEKISVGGEAWASVLSGTNSNKTTTGAGKVAKYQTIDGHVRAGGTEICATNVTGTLCRANQAPATPQAMPIQDSDISTWRTTLQNSVTAAQGNGGQTFNSNQTISGSATWGPTRINGDLIVTNGATLTLTGPLWVTGSLLIDNGGDLITNSNILVIGNVTLSNNATIALDPSLGEDDGLLITDGQMTIANGVTLTGSGNVKSSLTLITTNNTVNPNEPSISASNTSVGVIYYAKEGLVRVGQTGDLNAVLAKTVYLDNNATVRFSPSVQYFTVPNPNPTPITTQSGTWEEL